MLTVRWSQRCNVFHVEILRNEWYEIRQRKRESERKRRMNGRVDICI